MNITDHWAIAQAVSSVIYTALTLIIAVFSVMATRIASMQARENLKANAESLKLAKAAADAAVLNAQAAIEAQRPWLELIVSPDGSLTLHDDPTLKVVIELYNTGISPATRAIVITHAFTQSHGVASMVIDSKAQMVKDTLFLNMKAHSAGMTIFSKMPSVSHHAIVLNRGSLEELEEQDMFPFYVVAGVGYMFNNEFHTTVNAYLLSDETNDEEVNSIRLDRVEIPQSELKIRKLGLGTFVD